MTAERKTALVTGATSGLGLETSVQLARLGMRVVMVGRDPERTSAALADAAARSGAADLANLLCDFSSQADIRRLAAAFRERHQRLDVLVNNAGGSPAAPAATASPRFSEKIIALNLVAPLHCAQKANAVMQAQPEGGAIVNVASVSGLRPSPGTAAYGAAKAGLINLTESLAVEFAPKVRVNCVTAGALETDELHSAYGGDAYFEAVAATVPLGRMGRPPDVAKACLFLASEAASFITGTNLVVHGGGDDPPPVTGDG